MHAMLSLLLELAAQHSFNMSAGSHTAIPFSSSNGGIYTSSSFGIVGMYN